MRMMPWGDEEISSGSCLHLIPGPLRRHHKVKKSCFGLVCVFTRIPAQALLVYQQSGTLNSLNKFFLGGEKVRTWICSDSRPTPEFVPLLSIGTVLYGHVGLGCMRKWVDSDFHRAGSLGKGIKKKNQVGSSKNMSKNMTLYVCWYQVQQTLLV